MKDPLLKQVISAQINAYSFPLEIRALSGDCSVSASLTKEGIIQIGEKAFVQPDDAMTFALSHLVEPKSALTTTSNGWQFWGWFNPARNAWTPLEHMRAEYVSRQQEQEIKTSVTHPLRIDYVEVTSGGRIGLTFCPGKQGYGLYGGEWQRDLQLDLESVQQWGALHLISLMEVHEFELLGVSQFAEAVKASNLKWHHLPIKDMDIPGDAFEHLWQQVKDDLHQTLAEQGAVVIHCRGGLGRTGMLAARMLIESGVSPEKAILKVRQARPGSIETYAQEEYVLTQPWMSI
ncbi:cyclin-dependent kinase inhibitor 3 family protein [Pleionea sp. CnH1-48]|uniref:cyclin-dependent kinase inhibitor 3 family protein n=1 Tax=Pleionea sp. CnH1-48 TaxID=2954494 RepID=UPI002096CBEC|nr:cyclin-dependent kinase inhibitor 3 family protein [Pleionea sp. CnH1-48]MCO7226739.1 cyclin-dependent kinase inhibitor 3 family protein [Pleionea sp. CnH1-48]